MAPDCKFGVFKTLGVRVPLLARPSSSTAESTCLVNRRRGFDSYGGLGGLDRARVDPSGPWYQRTVSMVYRKHAREGTVGSTPTGDTPPPIKGTNPMGNIPAWMLVRVSAIGLPVLEGSLSHSAYR